MWTSNDAFVVGIRLIWKVMYNWTLALLKCLKLMRIKYATLLMLEISNL